MTYQTHLAAVAMAVCLATAACGGSHNSSTATSTSATSATADATTTTAPATATTTPGGNADLRRLIPTPVNTQRTDGPDPVHDNGIHMHFVVNGSPTDVMGAYKSSLEGMNWSVTTVSSGGGGGGGGATYTGTNGNAYGVFSGGGYGSTTDIHACVWPSKPANPNCGHGDQ